MPTIAIMNPEKIKIEPEWKEKLLLEFGEPYMADLKDFLRKEAAKGKTIYPRGQEIFNAFNLTPYSKVKVVIIGQDPYHGPGQAHGLCFSVADGVRPPPSLQNIFKEMKEDLGFTPAKSGNLQSWAEQGVLLLNTSLTVEKGMAGSHRGKGWEKFTDKVIEMLSQREDPIVFILWGAMAQGKEKLIRMPPHAIIKSAHPSPLSAYNGFFGSKPFSRTNALLKKWGKQEINWQL